MTQPHMDSKMQYGDSVVFCPHASFSSYVMRMRSRRATACNNWSKMFRFDSGTVVRFVKNEKHRNKLLVSVRTASGAAANSFAIACWSDLPNKLDSITGDDTAAKSKAFSSFESRPKLDGLAPWVTM